MGGRAAKKRKAYPEAAYKSSYSPGRKWKKRKKGGGSRLFLCRAHLNSPLGKKVIETDNLSTKMLLEGGRKKR